LHKSDLWDPEALIEGGLNESTDLRGMHVVARGGRHQEGGAPGMWDQERGGNEFAVMVCCPEVAEINALSGCTSLKGRCCSNGSPQNGGKRAGPITGLGLAEQQLRRGAVTSTKESSKSHTVSVTGKPPEP
jgi:hypothetical protein